MMRAHIKAFGTILLLLGAFLSEAAASFDGQNLSADDKRRLRAGHVLVSVQPLENSSVRIQAVMDIPAPRDQVWRVITRCADAPDYVPYLKSCRILKQSQDGHEDTRELIGSWGSLFSNLNSVVRSRYDQPGRIRFEMAAGDFRQLRGEWRFQPIDRSRATRVFYEVRVALNIPAPVAIVRSQISADVPNILRALRNEVAGQRH